jgi:hypothetical protein
MYSLNDDGLSVVPIKMERGPSLTLIVCGRGGEATLTPTEEEGPPRVNCETLLDSFVIGQRETAKVSQAMVALAARVAIAALQCSSGDVIVHCKSGRARSCSVGKNYMPADNTQMHTCLHFFST